MANDYPGSIAQQYISFSALFSVSTNPGASFGKSMIFVDAATLSGVWTGSIPPVGTDFELTSQDYTDFATGGLLSVLQGYFGSNSIANVFIACWDSGQAAYSGLLTSYTANKYDAYFKTLYTAGLGIESNVNAACVALAQFAFSDTGIFSQVGFGTKVADNLVNGSGTSLTTAIKNSTGDAIICYGDSSQSTDPFLDQLGLTLGALNGSGTAIGNSLDRIATLDRLASGTNGANLGPASVAALVAQNVGFWATLGNGTGAVALTDPKTVKGNFPGADWVVAYIDFVASIKSVEFLTDPATPQGKRRNNDNYQAILGILTTAATPFTTNGGIGVLDNFTTKVAPPFSQLSGGGSTLIVPHAWQADYLQNIETIQVQGTLFIQA